MRTAGSGVDGLGIGLQKSSPACVGEGGGLYLGRDGGVKGSGLSPRDWLLVTLSWYPVRARPCWTMDAVRKQCEGAIRENMSSTKAESHMPWSCRKRRDISKTTTNKSEERRHPCFRTCVVLKTSAGDPRIYVAPNSSTVWIERSSLVGVPNLARTILMSTIGGLSEA